MGGTVSRGPEGSGPTQEDESRGPENVDALVGHAEDPAGLRTALC